MRYVGGPAHDPKTARLITVTAVFALIFAMAM